MRALSLILAVLLAGGCARTVDNAVDGAQEATALIEDQAVDAQAGLAEATTPAILGVQDALAAIAEPLPPPAVSRTDLETSALITRWEIGSTALYVQKYRGVICPGGASGPTVGIGYDLGTQTQDTIRADWREHPDVDRLATASGQVGPGACAAWRNAHRDIRVELPMAQEVFAARVLPDYTRQAQRALRKGWSGNTEHARGAAVSLGYNRGWSMVGDRNREKREIRDACFPGADARCTADQLRAMTRLWVGTPIAAGMTARRNDEARFAVRLP